MKIGIAVNVENRMRELRRDGVTRIVHTWHRPKDCRLVEYQVRWLLRESVAPRQGQEWFTVSADEAKRVIEQAISDVEAGRNKLSAGMRRRKKELGEI